MSGRNVQGKCSHPMFVHRQDTRRSQYDTNDKACSQNGHVKVNKPMNFARNANLIISSKIYKRIKVGVLLQQSTKKN